jgi:intracellular septation protein A
MKTSLSLFWRVLVVQLLFTLVAVLALKNTALMSDPQYAQVKVSLLFSALAAILIASQFFAKRSPFSLVFGNRLGMSAQFWQRLTYALASFYLALAAANVVVAQVASFGTWAMAKTVVPLPALAVFILAVTPRLKKQRALYLAEGIKEE